MSYVTVWPTYSLELVHNFSIACYHGGWRVWHLWPYWTYICISHRAGLHWTIKWHSPSLHQTLGLGSGVTTLVDTLLHLPLSCTPGGSSGVPSLLCSEHTAQRMPTMIAGYGSTPPWAVVAGLVAMLTSSLFVAFSGKLRNHEKVHSTEVLPRTVQLLQCQDCSWWRYIVTAHSVCW